MAPRRRLSGPECFLFVSLEFFKILNAIFFYVLEDGQNGPGQTEHKKGYNVITNNYCLPSPRPEIASASSVTELNRICRNHRICLTLSPVSLNYPSPV